MKLLNGFFWYSMPGMIQGCYPPSDIDCEFVNSCLSDITSQIINANHHALGSGRWTTVMDCDDQCHWEIQEERLGDAFEMSEGFLTIQMAGLYMIDTALWNDNSAHRIIMRKNGNDISAG